MQETTFNSSYQSDDNETYASVHLWLDALYEEASRKILLKNLDASLITLIPSIQNLEKNIGYQFKDKNLLVKALTQSTFCYEFKGLNLSSNERLEFLGDSLVNFIIAKILYKLYPSHNEGDLSKLRGALVNEIALSKLAEMVSLGENLLLGKGEHKNQGLKKASILADAFEALSAAIYLDSGNDIGILEKSLENIIAKYETSSGKSFFALSKLEHFDTKTMLQEISMSLFQVHPTYKSVEVDNGFKVELWIGDRKLAEASGVSKKKLEKELARVVLDEKRYQ